MFGMEIPKIILTKSLKISLSSTLNGKLDELLRKLETRTIEDFLNGEKVENIRKIDNEIRQLVIDTVHSGGKSENSRVQDIAQLIFTERSYLINGISNADVKSILIFLSVNCYLQIKIESLLSKQELSEQFTQPIADKLLKLLSSIKLETQALPNAPYHKREMMNESKKGFANNDIKRTYHLIESIERGGRGFHFNFLLESLIAFLSRLNLPSFLKVLSALDSPQSFVFYLQSLKKEKLFKLANEPSLTNKWLNFELIRQIIEKNQKQDFEVSECVAIKNALVKIQTNDFYFFKQTIKYFHSSNQFNASLGELLISLSNLQIKEIISDCFVIDKYIFHHEARKFLLKHFKINATDQQHEFLLSTIFKKWYLFFESLLSSLDFYQNELILTDFCDYIVNYHTLLMSDKDVIIQMKNLISKIKFIDAEWAITESKQLTNFYLYYSKLYLLSYAYKNKKLSDTEIANQFTELKQNEIQIQRYSKMEKSTHIDIIAENINWLDSNGQN